jgi:transaldolase
MNRVPVLRDLGQSLWLDNITRELIDSGTLRRYVDEYCVTGLTSNPTIFEHAIGNTGAYDAGRTYRARCSRTVSTPSPFGCSARVRGHS